MISDCVDAHFDDVLSVINEAAEAYRGIIPADCWQDPYMDRDEFRDEISAKIAIRGSFDLDARLIGVMGAQPVSDVVLIRHAYIRPAWQRKGVGSALIQDLLARADRPILVGTWAAAIWAIEFYQKHGFDLASEGKKDQLLRRYWNIPERQIETSVVLTYRG